MICLFFLKPCWESESILCCSKNFMMWLCRTCSITLQQMDVKDTGMYSRTSMARTRRDRRCEFDLSMCSSDTKPDNFQGGSCVLYVITDTTFFDQSCKAHVKPVTDH